MGAVVMLLAQAPQARAETAVDGVQLRGTEQSAGQSALEASEARRRTLAADIATLTSDRARFQTALLETTRRVTETERRVADSEARLASLVAREAATRLSLSGRRAAIAEVLAALQRMGRKPPPALLVEPDDVLAAIRTSMLLGAVLPGMRAEIEVLASDLADLSRTRHAIEDERRSIALDLASLRAEKTRLAGLVEARQASLGQAEGAMAAERETAARLAGEAGSLKELITRSESEDKGAAKAAEAARGADQTLAMLTPAPLPPKDPARLAPVVAFASTKGTLSLPVGGATPLRRYGEDDGLGGTEKGTLLSARADATVVAPADGWVAFSGPYRSFGQLLILNAGGGYYIVLAGMDRVNVTSGQFVLAGEPVGVMGDGSNKTAAAIALGAAQPLLYVEFRKDGATIDPGPWWAKPELQKVRG